MALTLSGCNWVDSTGVQAGAVDDSTIDQTSIPTFPVAPIGEQRELIPRARFNNWIDAMAGPDLRTGIYKGTTRTFNSRVNEVLGIEASLKVECAINEQSPKINIITYYDTPDDLLLMYATESMIANSEADFTTFSVEESGGIYSNTIRESDTLYMLPQMLTNRIFRILLMEDGVSIQYVFDLDGFYDSFKYACEWHNATNNYVNLDESMIEEPVIEEPVVEEPVVEEPVVEEPVVEEPVVEEQEPEPVFVDKNCGDFETQSEAQEFFIAAKEETGERDAHFLDSNGDETVCEYLPE